MILEKCTKLKEEFAPLGVPTSGHTLKYTKYDFPLGEIDQTTGFKIICRLTLCEQLKPFKDYPNYRCLAYDHMNRFNISLIFMKDKCPFYHWSSNYHRHICDLDQYFIGDCVAVLQAVRTYENALDVAREIGLVRM